MGANIPEGLAVAAGTCMAAELRTGKRQPLYPDHEQLFDHLLDRLDLMEARLNALEMNSIDEPRLAKIVDAMVSLRTSKLEKTLAEQSTIIAALSQRADNWDANMQKLIAAVERLCETTLPFETELSEAMKRADSVSRTHSPSTIFQERRDPA
jgi:hypothetical protein